jgi:hypothetical protein
MMPNGGRFQPFSEAYLQVVFYLHGVGRALLQILTFIFWGHINWTKKSRSENSDRLFKNAAAITLAAPF